jgi:hypothetical protein
LDDISSFELDVEELREIIFGFLVSDEFDD